MTDAIIYILIYENGTVLAFRSRADAEAELADDPEGRIEEAYLQ